MPDFPINATHSHGKNLQFLYDGHFEARLDPPGEPLIVAVVQPCAEQIDRKSQERPEHIQENGRVEDGLAQSQFVNDIGGEEREHQGGQMFYRTVQHAQGHKNLVFSRQKAQYRQGAGVSLRTDGILVKTGDVILEIRSKPFPESYPEIVCSVAVSVFDMILIILQDILPDLRIRRLCPTASRCAEEIIRDTGPDGGYFQSIGRFPGNANRGEFR